MKSVISTEMNTQNDGNTSSCRRVVDITPLIIDSRADFSRRFDLVKEPMTYLKNNAYLSFVGEDTEKCENGVKCLGNESVMLGITDEIKAFPYVARAEFDICSDADSPFDSVAFGIGAGDLEKPCSDGGVWVSILGNNAYLLIGTESVPVLEDLDTDGGICVQISGEKCRSNISVNGRDVADITYSDGKLSIFNGNGELLDCRIGDILFNDASCGYFRLSTNKCKAILKYFGFEHRSDCTFSPKDEVLSFKKGRAYSFLDKKSYYHSIRAFEENGRMYAELAKTSEMLGFECVTDGEKAYLKLSDACIIFENGSDIMTVNGEKYVFAPIKSSDGVLCVDVQSFGALMGYASEYINDEICVLYGKNSVLTDEKRQCSAECFRLYEQVVFNYDDVECGHKGLGLYTSIPASERVVAVAYSPWNCLTKTWWKGAWSKPLYGEYRNDDEKLLRYHAELLAAADVDFVFLDWSNNTQTDAAMINRVEIFRMIEQTTDLMFKVWSTVENAPKIALFVGPGHAGIGTLSDGAHESKVQQIYDSYILDPENRKMYYYYEGKPLLICYGATPTQYGFLPHMVWDDERFTVRWMSAYIEAQKLCDDDFRSEVYWSWEEKYEQTYTVHNGAYEAMTVSAATRGGDENRNDGATFKKQFQRACDLGVKIAVITTFNEWTSGEQPSFDQSRDTEPSVAHGTFYYDLMRELIKKFKGKV